MRCPEGFSFLELRCPSPRLTPASIWFFRRSVFSVLAEMLFTPHYPSTGDRLRCKPPPFATEAHHAHPRHRTTLCLGTTRRSSHPRHHPRLPRHRSRSVVARWPPRCPRQGSQRLEK